MTIPDIIQPIASTSSLPYPSRKLLIKVIVATDHSPKKLKLTALPHNLIANRYKIYYILVTLLFKSHQ